MGDHWQSGPSHVSRWAWVSFLVGAACLPGASNSLPLALVWCLAASQILACICALARGWHCRTAAVQMHVLSEGHHVLLELAPSIANSGIFCAVGGGPGQAGSISMITTQIAGCMVQANNPLVYLANESHESRPKCRSEEVII